MSPNKSIHARLIDFQSKMKAISKSKNNPFYKSKYADFSEIQIAIQPILTECKLGYMFRTVENGLECSVFDEEGVSISFVYPVVLQGKPQEIGSAITYAKRYSLCAILGIIVADDDDDGQEGNKTPPAKQAKPKLGEQQIQAMLGYIKEGKSADVMKAIDKYDVTNEQLSTLSKAITEYEANLNQ